MLRPPFNSIPGMGMLLQKGYRAAPEDLTSIEDLKIVQAWKCWGRFSKTV